MHFGSLDIENILPFQQATLSLANRGLVLITGEKIGSASADSNGAGKSSLIECLLLALFGRTQRKMRGDAVTHFRRGNGLLRLRGVTEKEVGFILERPFKHSTIPRVQMHWDNSDCAIIGDASVTKAIQEDLLGPISFGTFVASSIFGGRGLFPHLGDDAKKQIFEELLSLEEVEKAYNRTKTVMDALVKERVKLERLKAQGEGEEKALREFIQIMTDRIAQFEEQQITQFRAKQETRQQLELEAKNASESMQKAAQEETEATVAHRSAMVHLEEARRKETEADRQHQDILSRRSTTKAEWDQHLSRIRSIEKMRGTCAECEQIVPLQKKESLHKKYNQEVVSIEQSYTELGHTLAVAVSEVGAAKRQTQALIQETSSLAVRIQAAHSRAEQWSTIRSQAYARIENLAKETAALLSMAPLNEAKKSLEKATQDLRALKIQLAKYDLEIQDLTEQLDTKYEFWLEGTGNQGLKSWLIEDALPFVNERALEYSHQLTDGELIAQICATKKTQKGEDRERMMIEVTTPFAVQDYEWCSKGEQCRADIVTTLAIGDYASLKCPYPIRLAMLDELFDPLDETGADKAMKLLMNLKTERESIFVISHSPFVKGHFTSQETVIFESGVAHLA